MTAEDIKEIVKCGENSTVQFKLLFNKAEDIANELIAFSNSNGGQIFIGINDKTGEIEGLTYKQIQDIGSLIASAANVGVHPSVFPIVDSKTVDGKAVMIISVSRGITPPYSNNRGEVYVKQGPDKRRVTDSNEMLRLFAMSGNYQPDRQPIHGTSLNDLDQYLLNDYFERTLGLSSDNLGMPLERALKNLFILDENGEATLGGLMFFGKKPQLKCPSFNIKAVWFYGNSIGGTEYRSSADIDGPIQRLFDDGLRFIISCLHRIQAGQNFNSVGKLEIPEVALSEILQNALVHRSWLKPAPIRLLIFDNRVEIISPGALHPTLTVDDIKMGNAYQRNQLMATLCAKTMNYRGLGSGIIRALQSDPDIEFHNEASGDQFRVIFWRKTITIGIVGTETGKGTEPKDQIGEKIGKKMEPEDQIGEKIGKKIETEDQIGKKIGKKTETEDQIGKKIGKKEDLLLKLISDNPETSISNLAHLSGMATSTVQIYLDKLKSAGKIKRIGPDKGGHWKVL
ncbi:MAG: putative DNA binding domain-containing protein [Muribaculaceae bacterium]|nr:putative DNA binding domain-containing protein [Muribaculaceae bacterium]